MNFLLGRGSVAGPIKASDYEAFLTKTIFGAEKRTSLEICKVGRHPKSHRLSQRSFQQNIKIVLNVIKLGKVGTGWLIL